MSVILSSIAMATFGTGLMMGFRATIMSLARTSESSSRLTAGPSVAPPSVENA